MKRAADIMTVNPVYLKTGDLISEAVKKMLSLHISSAPVVDMQGVIVGQLSEVQLLKAYILISKPENAYKTLQDFIQLLSHPITVNEDTPIDQVVKLVVNTENHRVVVLDGKKKLKGVISPKDLLRYLVGDQHQAGTMMDELRILKDRVGILKDQLNSTKTQLKQFETVINKSDFMVHSVDASGKILIANEKMHMELGYSPKELVGKTIFDIYDINFHKQVQESLNDIVLGNRESIKTYSTYLTKLRKPIRVEVYTTPIRDGAGAFVSTSSISRILDSDELLRALHGA